MKTQLFIPTKLKVGYQKRLDTYSKKLAYVTYLDEKNKLRKETSWRGWINNKMGIDDFENVPTEGFVLNRNVGGVTRGYSDWYDHDRIEKVRVFDPRGFEFEVTIPNVLQILQECTSTKGKGLEGTFVYAWSGAELVLLPTNAKEYKDSQEYTNLQSAKVAAKDLIVGASYKTKKEKTLIYLGKLEWFGRKNYGGDWKSEMKHIFVDENAHIDDYECELSDFESEKEYESHLKYIEKEKAKALKNGENIEFIPLASVSSLAVCVSETPVSNYAELMDKFNSTINASAPESIVEKEVYASVGMKKVYSSWWEFTKEDSYNFIKEDGKYFSASYTPNDNHSKGKPTTCSLSVDSELIIKDGSISTSYINYDNEVRRKLSKDKLSIDKLSDMKFLKLSVKLKNGKIVSIDKYL